VGGKPGELPAQMRRKKGSELLVKGRGTGPSVGGEGGVQDLPGFRRWGPSPAPSKKGPFDQKKKTGCGWGGKGGGRQVSAENRAQGVRVTRWNGPKRRLKKGDRFALVQRKGNGGGVTHRRTPPTGEETGFVGEEGGLSQNRKRGRGASLTKTRKLVGLALPT